MSSYVTMGDPGDEPIEHLSVNKLSALLNPLIQKAVASSFTVAQEEINTHTIQIAQLKQENEDLTKLVKEQTRSNESQKRQKNLIFHGLQAPTNEDHVSLQNTIVKFCNETLGVNVAISDIDFTKRIGNRIRNSERPAPILLRLTSLRMKLNILAGCPKLKGSSYSISNDYCKEDLEIRNSFYPLVRALKARGVLAQLRDITIFINKKSCIRKKAEELIKSLDRKRDRSETEGHEVEEEDLSETERPGFENASNNISSTPTAVFETRSKKTKVDDPDPNSFRLQLPRKSTNKSQRNSSSKAPQHPAKLSGPIQSNLFQYLNSSPKTD